jgi:pyridinium-3,5-biscarboxylic acid mononucleotide synthase
MNDIRLDFSRRERLGFDEAIFCAGKSVAQIEAILTQSAGNGGRFLLTRLAQEKFDALPAAFRESLDYDQISSTAFHGEPSPAGVATRVAVICAGSSDLPVAREAVRTLRYYGENALECYDIGVAGLWRLTERVEEIRAMPVVITVAGMDAALISVVGGLCPAVIIGVPTSVGYGVASGGETALRASLASCAPGVVVVNIDNGYGAACAALRVLRAGAAR